MCSGLKVLFFTFLWLCNQWCLQEPHSSDIEWWGRLHLHLGQTRKCREHRGTLLVPLAVIQEDLVCFIFTSTLRNLLNNKDFLNDFSIYSIKGSSHILLNNRIVCLYQKYIIKESFICNILFFRCKQLQLTTIRAFFDLIDANTKQVCIFKLKIISVK